jgi:hypothetical protein
MNLVNNQFFNVAEFLPENVRCIFRFFWRLQLGYTIGVLLLIQIFIYLITISFLVLV